MALIECPECKSAISAAAATCPKCGHPTSRIGRARAAEAVGKPVRSRKFLYVVSGLVVLIILLASNKEEKTAPSAPAATANQAVAAPSATAATVQTAAISSSAEFDDPTESLETANKRVTRFGIVEIVSSEKGDELVLDGRPAGNPSDVAGSLGLGPVIRFRDKDVIFARIDTPIAQGVNTCPAQYVEIVISSAGMKASGSFGKCSQAFHMTTGRDKVIVRTKGEAFFATTEGVKRVSVDEGRTEELHAEVDNPITDVTSLVHPLVKPDMKMYRWCGQLVKTDHVDDQNADTYIASWANHAFVGVASSIAERHLDNLRIGGPICLTGRYISNYDGDVPLLSIFRVTSSLQ